MRRATCKQRFPQNHIAFAPDLKLLQIAMAISNTVCQCIKTNTHRLSHVFHHVVTQYPGLISLGNSLKSLPLFLSNLPRNRPRQRIQTPAVFAVSAPSRVVYAATDKWNLRIGRGVFNFSHHFHQVQIYRT